ncbi:hypothetical protein C3489_08020 [Streptomyces sp. Ru71]|nr:hypothetical protein C3489_08020 [Streptomyces sp. Ru71]
MAADADSIRITGKVQGRDIVLTGRASSAARLSGAGATAVGEPIRLAAQGIESPEALAGSDIHMPAGHGQRSELTPVLRSGFCPAPLAGLPDFPNPVVAESLLDRLINSSTLRSRSVAKPRTARGEDEDLWTPSNRELNSDPTKATSDQLLADSDVGDVQLVPTGRWHPHVRA